MSPGKTTQRSMYIRQGASRCSTLPNLKPLRVLLRELTTAQMLTRTLERRAHPGAIQPSAAPQSSGTASSNPPSTAVTQQCNTEIFLACTQASVGTVDCSNKGLGLGNSSDTSLQQNLNDSDWVRKFNQPGDISCPRSHWVPICELLCMTWGKTWVSYDRLGGWALSQGWMGTQ